MSTENTDIKIHLQAVTWLLALGEQVALRARVFVSALQVWGLG